MKIGRFFYNFGGRFILLRAYKIYSFLKNEFKKGLAPLQNKLYFYLGNRHVIHFVLIFIALATAASNIQARESRNADLLAIERDSPLAKLVTKSPEEEAIATVVVEEVVINGKSKPAVCHYVDDSGIAKATPRIINKDQEAGALLQPLSREDTLAKPDIITTKEAEDYSLYNRIATEEYAVKEGDTVSLIAKKFGVTVETILWENNLTAYSTLKIGQKLTILPTSGITYRVKKGDTVEKIANSFKVDADKILAYNDLSEASGLKVGQVLVVPDARKVAAPARSTPLNAIKSFYQAPDVRNVVGFVWPTNCRRITQYYSWRHHAIDIACGYNIPIYAVNDGVVSSACWATGYGKRIIITHAGGVKTLYGHFNQLNVTAGQQVKKGQVIGLMGSTGHSTGPHVHFEVIIGSTKQNPLKYY